MHRLIKYADQVVIPMRLGSSQAFFLPISSGGVLIDSGNARKISHINSVLHVHEYDIRDIKYIILTHTHHDHVGSLAELAKRTGATVIVHEKEAGFLTTGRTPLPKGTNLFARMMVSVGRFARIGAYDPVIPDITVVDTLELSNIGLNGYVLYTPGHTLGSMSIVLRDGAAFVGDTLFNIRPDTIFPPFADDVKKLLQSWQRLLETNCEVFYPAHGKHVERETLKRCFEKMMTRQRPK